MYLQIRNAFILLLVCFVSCNKSNVDNTPPPVLRDGFYKNGNLRTGTTTYSGVAAPAGHYWNEAQHNTGNNSAANLQTGVACYSSFVGAYWLADDFIVPQGQTWNVSSVAVYAFVNQNNSSVSPFDGLRLELWKGNPSLAGATLVTGDLTTNVLAGAIDSLTYVISHSSVPAPGIAPVAATKVWKLTANLTATLPAGSYWLKWQVHPVTGTEVYSPFVKIVGMRGFPSWNAIVFNALGVWQPVADGGIPFSSPRIPQDVPFEVVYKY